MTAEHRPAGVHDGAGGPAQGAGQERACVTVGDEADVVAVRLGGHRQPARRRLGPHLRLGGVAEREQRPVKLLAGEHGEHVGLILGQIRAAVQAAVHQPRVVAGADRVEAQGHRPVQHGRELDLLVAAQTRVGGSAGGVLGHKIVDDVSPEPFGEIPDVERDADHVGDPARVAGILQRAERTSGSGGKHGDRAIRSDGVRPESLMRFTAGRVDVVRERYFRLAREGRFAGRRGQGLRSMWPVAGGQAG